MRLDNRCTWYYGWDCASGCIWDKDAIEHYYLIKEQETLNWFDNGF